MDSFNPKLSIFVSLPQCFVPNAVQNWSSKPSAARKPRLDDLLDDLALRNGAGTPFPEGMPDGYPSHALLPEVPEKILNWRTPPLREGQREPFAGQTYASHWQWRDRAGRGHTSRIQCLLYPLGNTSRRSQDSAMRIDGQADAGCRASDLLSRLAWRHQDAGG